VKRCEWCTKDEIYIKYHDEEWGEITKSERELFELLTLEVFQAGLNWLTILKKRENFRDAFDNFDYKKIATYDDNKVEELLKNKGIIRNKLKITATINNANKFMKIQDEYSSFYKYIWCFTENKQVRLKINSLDEYPKTNNLSERVTKDMKSKGFKFIGNTIIFSYLEAIGVMNNHMVGCYKFKK
jgi:DNA-3-methyladenine glycosylase I